ncbi:MAG: hypothetical protein KJ908_08145, partial [Acidobacteria bacterium]|nr:hypothetical protein [Acidobacteriota bacterium]
QAIDETEDERYGRGNRGDELPDELRFKQSRLAKIKEAKAALEQEAHERAEREKLEQSKEKGKNHHRGRPPKAPSDKPYTSRTHPGNGDNQRTHGPQTANDQRSWCLQKTQTDR